MKTILSIAGFDPSGGAGILADMKTIAALGGYGVSAITSLTYQNTRGVFGAAHQPGDVVARQLEPLFADFEIAAIKTGMLPSREVIEVAADAIAASGVAHIVIDPVVHSTSGFDLIDDEALAALVARLFPLASVVTPNAAEAERLTGMAVRDRQSMEQAGRKLLEMGACAALVKGGDLGGDFAADLLVDEEGATLFSVPCVHSRNTHGTGCTLAAALACLMAQGHSLREAIPVAKSYVAEAIRSAPGLGGGFGPLDHFPSRLPKAR